MHRGDYMDKLPQMQFPDYIVIAVYFVTIIFTGLYFSRLVRKVKDYFCAGSTMPWWLAGTSFYMASFTALFFVLYNEIAYVYGIVALSYVWILTVCIFISGMLLSIRWRRARTMTPIEFMERRFNKNVHQIFVWAGIPYRLLDNGLRIFTTALVLTLAMQNPFIDFNRFVLITGLIMIAYTYLGGQTAVIITDFIQAIIILIAVVVLFFMIIVRIDSIPSFLSSMPEGFFHPARKPYDWIYLLCSCFAIAVFDYGACWPLVQKYNTTRSEHDARKMVYYVTILGLIMPAIFIFPGLAARYLMPAIENTRTVYPVMFLTILPVGLIGFMIAALFSATLSTLGSEFNTLSGILTRDFYKKIINPDISERCEILFGRFATILVGFSVMAVAFALNSLKTLNLMDIMVRYFAAFGPPLSIPIVSGLLFRKFNSRGVRWGVIGGVFVGIGLQLSNVLVTEKYAQLMAANQKIDYWLRSGWTSIATLVTIITVFLLMWLGTRAKETSPDEKKRVDEFFTDIKKPFELDTTHLPVFYPFNIISFIVAVFGITMLAVSLIVLMFFHDMHSFLVNAIVGTVMLIGAGIMRMKSRNFVY